MKINSDTPVDLAFDIVLTELKRKIELVHVGLNAVERGTIGEMPARIEHLRKQNEKLKQDMIAFERMTHLIDEINAEPR